MLYFGLPNFPACAGLRRLFGFLENKTDENENCPELRVSVRHQEKERLQLGVSDGAIKGAQLAQLKERK